MLMDGSGLPALEQMLNHGLEYLIHGLNKLIMIKIVNILKNGFLNLKMFLIKIFIIGLNLIYTKNGLIVVSNILNLFLIMIKKDLLHSNYIMMV